MNAIEVEGLRKRFGEVVALDGLDLVGAEGEVLGLLGPNGAGKTTLVRALATLLVPDSGRATVLGYDVVADPYAVRRQIGLAGQFAAVDEAMTGRENLEMVGMLYHLGRTEAARRAAEVLERFALTDAADRRASTYSGGMRRRLDLAATLVGRPRVVFLDEPTSGLDPRSRNELWSMVRELRSEGTTILLTTQVRDPETAQGAGYVWVFPLNFVSSAFVPIHSMPAAVRAFADVNPITLCVDAVRALTIGGQSTNAVLGTLAWLVGLLLVFVPFAVSRYRALQ